MKIDVSGRIEVSGRFSQKIKITWLLGEVHTSHTFLESPCIIGVVHERYLEFYAELKNEIKNICSHLKK
jgi:hypothetical protein